MAVLVYQGYNQQGNVISVYPPPARTESLHHGRIVYAPGGLSYPHGYLSTRLTWNVLERLSFPLIKNQFGLDLTTTSAEITIALTDDDMNLTYWNAVANYDEDIRRKKNWNYDLVITILKMESVAAP